MPEEFRLTRAELGAAVEKYHDLLWREANRAWEKAGRAGERQDYYAAAVLGMCKAAERFDKRVGTRFVTLALHWIKREAMRHGRDESRAGFTATRSLGFFPGIRPARIGLPGHAGGTRAFHSRNDEDGREQTIDPGDRADHQPADARVELPADIWESVAGLVEQDVRALTLKFVDGLPDDQLAAELGVTRAVARRLVADALDKLWRDRPGLAEYFPDGKGYIGRQ